MSTNLTHTLRNAAPIPMAVLIAIAACGSARADDDDSGAPKLTLTASSRVRVETIDGQFRPATVADDTYVSSRTDVAAHVDMGGFSIVGEIVDGRGYGENVKSSVRSAEINTLEPVQSYIAYHVGNVLAQGDVLTLTGGRFAIDIGASRLVNRVDFPNTVPSYLGGMLDWRDKKKNHLVLFWTKPFTSLPDDVSSLQANDVEYDRASGSLTFFGGNATIGQLVGKMSVELYGFRLAEHDRSYILTRNRRLFTYGTRARIAPAKGKFDFEFEGALQQGKAHATTSVSDLKDLDVDAGFAHAEMGWTATSAWAPRFSVLFDYATGDGKGSTYTRFDSLFGARRADFGPTALYGPVGRSNLISPGVRVEAKPSPRFDLMASVRELWLADATDSFASTSVRDATGASGDHAGVQSEVRARRWLVPNRLKLEIGGAWLAKGYFLKHAPNAPHTGDTHYGYTDLSLTF